MRKIHPGGVLLLGWNIEDKKQLIDLIGGLQKIAKEDTNIPLFIAVDQEGGVVSRIGWADNTSQAEIKNQEEALKIGEKRGKELKESGINLNFAPLLDLASPGDFIFNRSFKKNSEESADLAMSLIEGQRNSGIFSTLKHFPGYGGIIYNPEEELAFIDGVPEISQFLKSTLAMPEMIMVSNVVYKEIDENLPFSFSPKGINYLEKTIKGNYLIISDDLAQNSLLNKFSLEQIIYLPIKAGVDILIFSGWRASPVDAFEAFLKSVSQGKITEDRIDQSVFKIISLKRIISE